MALQGLSKILPQKPQMLRGYLIRLTREYTDGGMDSRAKIKYIQYLFNKHH